MIASLFVLQITSFSRLISPSCGLGTAGSQEQCEITEKARRTRDSMLEVFFYFERDSTIECIRYHTIHIDPRINVILILMLGSKASPLCIKTTQRGLAVKNTNDQWLIPSSDLFLKLCCLAQSHSSFHRCHIREVRSD